MSDYYDRQGRPITIDEFSRLHRDPDIKIVRRTEIGDILISTVWLGLDHGWGSGRPVIFETMVFESGPLDQECRRYSTEAEAIAGHERMVDRVRFALSCRFAEPEVAV